jgi:dolichol kinase
VTDVGLTAVLGVALMTALASAVALARAGVPRTYVRDLIHVGAGSWVLAWPWFAGATAPIAITAAALALVLMGPRQLRDAISGDDERWGGVVLFVAAHAALTTVAFLEPGDRKLAAAGALLALSLGDGIGGLVGRRSGRI